MEQEIELGCISLGHMGGDGDYRVMSAIRSEQLHTSCKVHVTEDSSIAFPKLSAMRNEFGWHSIKQKGE